MSEITSLSEASDNIQPNNFNVPVRLNDICIFDGAFTFMKERFGEEMRRLEDEMTLLSKNLVLLKSLTNSYQSGVISDRQSPAYFLETIANSPLVEGNGKNKTLRLQFDVSQFEPGEIAVKVLDNTVVVTAQHVEKSDASIINNQYHREFQLPSGVDPSSVESALSKDGVLTVKAPLNLSSFAIRSEGSV